MTLADFTLPEVKVCPQAARFFRDGEKNKVEISFVGSKDTTVQVVTPQHMAQFREEWAAYCDGRPPEKRAGIPLTDLKSINEARAEYYLSRNIHNLEELAALNDGQCQAVGHGTLTDRKGARELVMSRQAQSKDRLHREIQEKTAAIGPVPAEKYAGNSEVESLKSEVAELKQGMGQILELLQKKPGRPKKSKATE